MQCCVPNFQPELCCAALAVLWHNVFGASRQDIECRTYPLDNSPLTIPLIARCLRTFPPCAWHLFCTLCRPNVVNTNINQRIRFICGRPFVKQFALCYRAVVCSARLSVCDVGVLWPNGWMDWDAIWCGGRPRHKPHCVRWGPAQKGAQQPPFFGLRLLWPNGHPFQLLLSSCWSLHFVKLSYLLWDTNLIQITTVIFTHSYWLSTAVAACFRRRQQLLSKRQ